MSYSYPSCATTIEWSKCADNCAGKDCVPCTSLAGDPCEVEVSGIGCVPKSCVDQCCEKLKTVNYALHVPPPPSGWGIL